jgi:hypothetical protein
VGGAGRATLGRVRSLLVVLLSVIVIAELIAVIGIAAALFWLGVTEAMLVGAGMLLVALVGGVLALRAMRPRR